MLKLDPTQTPTEPRDAATLLVIRPGAGEIELFCVRRHAKSAFMGGVVVFPGGKLDEADASNELAEASNGLHPRAALFADDAAHARALAVCACREALEEAAILPASPPPDAAAAEALRSELGRGHAFATVLAEASLTLNTSSLVPFARWITPVAEARRFDARFFVTALPDGQQGRHDEHETTSGVWASPRRLLEAYENDQLFLAPPTIRALEIFETAADVETAIARCHEQSLAPICPELVALEPLTLALPGDPEHSSSERRVSGPTRFVLREGRFTSENPG